MLIHVTIPHQFEKRYIAFGIPDSLIDHERLDKAIKMDKRIVRFLLIVVLGIVVALGTGLILSWGIPTIISRMYFAPQTTPLTATYDLWELGVTDANHDSNLDIFTINHSARQNLLLGDGSSKFKDVLSSWKLDQDRNFPFIEDTDKQPEIAKPGLYIYRQNFALHLRAHEIDNFSPIKGSLELALPVKIQRQQLATAKSKEQSLESGRKRTIIKFTIENNGWLTIEDLPEIPHIFVFENNLPLDKIILGQQKLHPKEHDFIMLWRDRHSMAWADLNADGQQDVFIGRGGVRGQLEKVSDKINDELFISQGSKYQDHYEKDGWEKGNCPGRQSAWVDFDNDGKLDLYCVCGRILPSIATDPNPYYNKLYHQEENGQFVNVAHKVGLDLPAAGQFYWLDVDDDIDLDVLITQEEKIQLYRNQFGYFEPQGQPQILGSTITQLAVADFDLDEDFDVYLVTKGEASNRLLVNDNGKYILKNPSELGLPLKGLDAAWVDYDNDGLTDLYVVPHGLYRQLPDRKFKKTRLLNQDLLPPFQTWNAHSTWFDVDNDGARDLLLAYQQTPSILQPTPSLNQRIINQLQKRDTSKIWQSELYRNVGAKNHWLQVKLTGTDGNRPAIGSKVQVFTSQGTQVQQVGMAENSRYSQGHYRMYFGLGKDSQPDLVRVIWANGEVEEIAKPPEDRILTIQQKNNLS